MSLRDSLRKQSIENDALAEVSSYLNYESVKAKIMNELKKGFEEKISNKDFKQTFHYMGVVSKYHYSASADLSIMYSDQNDSDLDSDLDTASDILQVHSFDDLSALLYKLAYDLKCEFEEVYYQLGDKYYDIAEIPDLIKDTKKTGSMIIKIFANLFCNRKGEIK